MKVATRRRLIRLRNHAPGALGNIIWLSTIIAGSWVIAHFGIPYIQRGLLDGW